MLKLVRITTIPLSLEKLLEGQLRFMSDYYAVTAISAEEKRLKAYAEAEGVSYKHIPLTRKITPFKDLVATYKLYRFLKGEQPSIVHTHTPKAGIVGMLAGRLAKVPNRLHTVAGLPLMEATGLKKQLLLFIEKLTYRYATKVYPNSKGLYDYILENKLCAAQKLQIIGKGSSNGIDTDYFDPNLYSEDFREEFRTSLRIPETDFVFLFVGRIVKDKGMVELVNAFHNISQEHSDTTLLLVGPLEEDLDPLPKETMKIVSENPKIITTGYQNDVRPYFSISEAFTFPSYREGFPNVVMQAGAMEVPAIVSDINGCNEIIEHGENGMIVPVKDADALQKSMEQLLKNPNFCNKLSKKSRQRVVSQYERREIWEAILKEYKSLEV